MIKFRKCLLVFVWASLLLVPYSFFSYLCYLGLCGGGESREIGSTYTEFYGYFCWIYFIIVMLSLLISKILNKLHHLNISTVVLCIPIISLVPYLYVEMHVESIHLKFKKQHLDYYSPHADDFVCSPGKFIRVDGKNRFSYFDYDTSYTSGSMSAYYSMDDLVEHMRKQSIDITQCKNKAGQGFQ